jgi:hypothetical protein
VVKKFEAGTGASTKTMKHNIKIIFLYLLLNHYYCM